MMRDVALALGRKGGPGSGFSDPNCRRGIPGQRGGSVNICEPGGMAKAIALGVDVSDVNINLDELTREHEGTTHIDNAHRLNQVVRERIDEPNKVIRRETISQQLRLPISPYQRDQEYRRWIAGPRAAPLLWDAAEVIEGTTRDDMRSFRRPRTIDFDESYRDRYPLPDFARSVAADVELSRELWPEEGQLAWRGLRVRKELEDDWIRAIDHITSSADPESVVYLPNNFLESWSDNYDQAAQFSGARFTDRANGQPLGVVVESHIPRRNVFLSHDAISQLEPEEEVIVVNRAPFDAVPVKNLTVIS